MLTRQTEEEVDVNGQTKTRFALLSLAIALACGGSGKKGSYSELKSKLDNPTGDLGTNNVKEVAAALAEEANSAPPAPGGTASSALSTASSAVTQPSCTQDVQGQVVNYKCDCSNGGYFEYSFDSTMYASSGECEMYVEYVTCSEDGTTVDGYAYQYFSDCSGSGGDWCYSFSGTVDGEPAEVDYCFLAGELWYIVELGGEVFGVKGYYDPNTGNGDWYVAAVDGTWYCTSSAGSGQCQNLDTMDTFSF